VSDPTDIKALDEFLKGDSEVSRQYRELGHDEVPPELDRRVLAAARNAVANEGTQRSRSWLRWSAPVALAASVVLVVTVVLERGPEDELAQVPAAAPVQRKLADEPRRQNAANPQEPTPVYIQPITQAPPALADTPSMPDAAPATTEVHPFVPPPDLGLEQASQRITESVADAPQASAAAPPEPAQKAQQSDELYARESAALDKRETNAAAAESESVSVSGMRARRGPGRTAGPRTPVSGTIGNARPAADDEQLTRADRSDPAAWLEDIRDLRRAGKAADADREWDRFREAFPDFHVADDDLARRKP
jgi:hypothetical protein